MCVESGASQNSKSKANSSDQPKTKQPVEPDKPLKRVRRLDEDSSGEEDCGQSQSPPGLEQECKGQQNSSLEQPAPKKMRKWVDSDSESEVSSGRESPSSARSSQRGGRSHIERDASVEGANVEDTDSEGEGQLEIDLDHQSQCQDSDQEMESVKWDIRSPVQDTVELVQDGDAISEQLELETQRENCGSLATLEIAESAQ